MNSAQNHIVIPAARARAAAGWFNYGNIASVLLPFPLGILWFGASMFLYTVNRHHPNERVGHYTQQAAYRFYAVMGSLLVIGSFFGANFTAWLVCWVIAAAILLPWSVYDLIKIRKEVWQDTSHELTE